MYIFSNGKKAYTVELIYNKDNESEFLDNYNNIIDSLSFNFKENNSI